MGQLGSARIAQVLIVTVAAWSGCQRLPEADSTPDAPEADPTSSTSSGWTSSDPVGSTGSGADGSTGAPDGTTGVFIEDPDGGAGSIECDVWSQDCPAGEKCMPWANDGGSAWNALRCSPLAEDPRQVGESCTVVGNGVSGVDDCELGAMCWDVDPETNEGYCVAFCTGGEASPTCADPTSFCAISCDGVLTLCLPGCDPLEQDCHPGNVCIAANGRFSCVLDASGDEGQAGDPCEYANVCDPGLFCSTASAVPNCEGSFGCCASYCDLTAPDCPELMECVPWFAEGQAPPQHEMLGACVAAAGG